MRALLRVSTVLLALALIFSVDETRSQSQLQDVVYLKDGRIVRGVIIEQVPNKSIKIQTANGNISIFEMEKVDRLTKESIQMWRSEKSPLLAGVLSFAVPGLGQFYNGDVLWGVVHLGVATAGVVTALTLGFESERVRTGTETVRDFYGNFRFYRPRYGYEDEPNELFFIGLGVAAATVVWSVIDAIVTANDINRSYSVRGIPEKNQITWRIHPVQDGMQAGVTIQF